MRHQTFGSGSTPATYPVRALRAWIEILGTTTGRCSGPSIATCKSDCLVTAAADRWCSRTRHHGPNRHRFLTTLRKYIREGLLFLEDAAAKVGL